MARQKKKGAAKSNNTNMLTHPSAFISHLLPSPTCIGWNMSSVAEALGTAKRRVERTTSQSKKWKQGQATDASEAQDSSFVDVRFV